MALSAHAPFLCRALLLVTTAAGCLLPSMASGQSFSVDCDATIAAWRSDSSMRQYMHDHTCRCSNGRSRPPVCTSNSSGTSSSGSSHRTSSSKSKYSTKAAALKGIQDGLNQSLTIDHAAIERANQQRLEGARQLHDEQLSVQQDVEQGRQQAAQVAAAARAKQIQDLSKALQGMPGSGSGLDFSSVLNDDARRRLQYGAVSGTGLEPERMAIGSGFDTAGKLAGQPPPPPPMPAPVKLEIPEERITPQMQVLMQERQAVQSKKKELVESLSRYESKVKLTPEDTVEVAKLKQEISVTQNKENFYEFSINQELEKQ